MRTNKALISLLIFMVFGIFIAVSVSIYAIQNPYSTENTVSAEKSSTTDDFNPATFYQNTCSSCHGSNFEGGSGPSLLGIGKNMTENEIMNILLNGKNSMPKDLVPDEHMQQMVKFVHSL